MNWHLLLTGVGAVAALVAAGFWLWGSVVPVPNNIDTIVGELQRISRLNAYGAMAACVAAICAVVLFIRDL